MDPGLVLSFFMLSGLIKGWTIQITNRTDFLKSISH
jgi:hypothetical protein